MNKWLASIILLLPLNSYGYSVPPVGVSWQWQLTGTINTSVNASLFDVDLFDVPATTVSKLKSSGKYMVCYISAGTWENWRPDASKYPNSVKGASNGWPGEKWLDIRSPLIRPIIEARMDMCVKNGYQAIEPDNIDGYANKSGFPLTYNDQLVFNKWLADTAHKKGLAIALKNDGDQVKDLVGLYDFAIVEECLFYKECAIYSPFVQNYKPVLATEYSGSFPAMCSQFPKGFSGLKKNTNLDAARQSCN